MIFCNAGSRLSALKTVYNFPVLKQNLYYRNAINSSLSFCGGIIRQKFRMAFPSGVDMDKAKALQKLLQCKATMKEIELLKQALASGEILIRGNVIHSIN
jgi:hypothetical protein